MSRTISILRHPRWLVPLLLAVACAEDAPRAQTAAVSPVASRAPPPPPREAWWEGATKRASGREKILAPRELRALLAEGRRHGFHADAAWWNDRVAWASERILRLDPDDIEANAGAGRRTLQSIEGFDALWERMVNARFPGPGVEQILDQYAIWVLEDRPIFLTADELTVMTARLREAERHLERLEADPGYAADQMALRRVKASALNDYPFIHRRVGPFIVFYAARDLQPIPGEDQAAEQDRVRTRAEFYRRRLESWEDVYTGVVKDIATLYPEVAKRHPIRPDTIFHQWIFGEREWYRDHRERLGKEEAARPYRVGYFNGASGWAFMAEPGPGDPDGPDPDDKTGVSPVLKETAAYLAAVQVLRQWGADPEDPTHNHLDTSRAYWLKEGWPTFLAARRVEKPAVGRAFRATFDLPDLQRVVERRSFIDRGRFYTVTPVEGAPLLEGGYTDLAWILVRYLNEDQERRSRFERFLLSQVEGGRRGLDWFEECFDVKGEPGWKRLQQAVYGTED